MGGLSENLQKQALLKIRTAGVKKKKGLFLRAMETALLRSNAASRRLNKKSQHWMNSRYLAWAQYDKRKKEFARDVYENFNTKDVDFVLCHDSKAIDVATKIAQEHGAVLGFDLVELTLANLRDFQPSLLTKRKLLQSESKIAKADFMISGDSYLSQEFKTRHKNANPVLILNGQEADFPTIEENLRMRLGDTTERPIILFIGMVAELRGIEQIIDAFAQIRTDALLAIVGPGNVAYIDGLRERISSLGMNDKAKFLEGVPQKDVIPLASTATIGISPISAKTGNAGLILNNKLFQYLASGLPIVSTDVPGAGGFVTKYGVGYVYKEDDVSDLARQIDSALDDIANGDKLRDNIQKTAQKFTWEDQQNILKKYIRQTERTTERN